MTSENKGCQDISDLGDFLVMKATTVNVGEMVEIIAKTPFGLEWRSSLKGDWFMQIPSLKKLILNWDGLSTVCWFWDATFHDGKEVKAHVTVPPKIMKEIKDWLSNQPTDSSS